MPEQNPSGGSHRSATGSPNDRALVGIRVIDFSTLVPGPFATLLLAEAGAEVIKIERPGGDEMRTYEVWPGEQGTTFALLNRGKRSVEIDLKRNANGTALTALVRSADVLVEQFRPGVMARLGLGHDALAAVNPGLVYCSITGYGQTGPKALKAGHDLNYLAETGLLHTTAVPGGQPMPPEVLIADIAGGAYPAVMNILLALRERDKTARGCHLDVSMSGNMFPLAFAAIGQGLVRNQWPQPGQGLFTGGSPRYRLYRTADDRFVAVAALEDRFWERFCGLIDLPRDLRDDAIDAGATQDAVTAIMQSRTADYWRECFAGADVCCSIVARLDQALDMPQFRAGSSLRGHNGAVLPPLPTSVDPRFCDSATASSPRLGEANEEYGFAPAR